MFLAIVLAALLSLAHARSGFGPGDQEWGHVTVRPHCQMFWWLYKTTTTATYTDRPLIIWLPGGPGGSGASANLGRIGLVDPNLNPRASSWVHRANILYVDQPVGVGWSYVDNANGGTFATTTEEAAADFVAMVSGFMAANPEFETVPLYIMGESYGGKYAPAFAEKLHREVVLGNLTANLAGVGMAYPITDLIANCEEYGEVLYQTGIADAEGRDTCNTLAVEARAAGNLGNWVEANDIKDVLINFVLATYQISFAYLPVIPPVQSVSSTLTRNTMNDVVGPLFSISLIYDAQTSMIAPPIIDKVAPTLDSVKYLLENTNSKVYVYNGQVDWVVNLEGTYRGYINMDWHGADGFRNADRKAFYVDDIVEGYEKKYGQLAFYWVNHAGHILPDTNPGANDYILEQLIGF